MICVLRLNTGKSASRLAGANACENGLDSGFLSDSIAGCKDEKNNAADGHGHAGSIVDGHERNDAGNGKYVIDGGNDATGNEFDDSLHL